MLTIHMAFGGVALLAGTRRHRAVGWVYVAAMAGLVLTSFTNLGYFRADYAESVDAAL